MPEDIANHEEDSVHTLQNDDDTEQPEQDDKVNVNNGGFCYPYQAHEAPS